jgi:16S rRNA (uracil1498-N3)-methyltransferase
MRRFYVPKENVRKDGIIVDGKEAHHILDVMRMQDGDQIVIFDGTGKEYVGFIKEADRKKKRMIVEIVRTEKPVKESAPEIILAQAIPKKSKMEYIIEKATELGVSRVVPLVSERTIARPKDTATSKKKVKRWRKIAIEASKQCGRTNVPVIDEITEYGEMAHQIDLYDLTLLACLTGETVSIKESLDGFKSGKILVFIGPEGDFTPEERQMADKGNCKFVSLGKRILRSDTAGLFVLSAIDYEFSV